jgi:stage II sporulation protein D
VIGTRGRTRVSGATLRARLGLYDTWAYFTTIGIRRAPAPETPVPTPPAPVDPQSAGAGTGGAGAAMAGRRAIATLTGSVLPAHRGAEVQVQLRRDGRWSTVASTGLGAGGRYRVPVTRRGTYRVVYWGDAGDSIVIR